MYKYIYLIVISVFCSMTAMFGQTEDYAKLASESFSNGSYSQALVYCSMYAAEKSERLPIEKNVKLCLEYERQFDDAVMNENVSLAKVFCDRITALNPGDKRIKSRMSALETQVRQSRVSTKDVSTNTSTPTRRSSVFMRIPNYFNIEATIVKDLEVGFSMNYSFLMFGVNWGYDIWKDHRLLSEPFSYTPQYKYSTWTHEEIVHPMHLMVHGGLFFKYFAIDCGVGYVFAKTRKATYGVSGFTNDCSAHEHTDETRQQFFTFRPEVKVFIPFSGHDKDYHCIFTFGYNFVKDANCMEGITICTGWGWSF